MNNSSVIQSKASTSCPIAARLVHEYTKAHLIYALIETGVFKALRESQDGVSVASLAHSNSLSEDILRGVLDYLALSQTLLIKSSEGKYHLKEPNSWLLNEALRYELLLSMGAYQSIMSNLVPSLKREIVYGQDYQRDGRLLATASFGVTKENYPAVVSELRSRNITTVADLGCGAAELLISFCQMDQSLFGVDIDIDRETLKEASRRIYDAGLSHRIVIIEGDLTDPTGWLPEVKSHGVGAFTCIGVLHEFLREGKEAVRSMLLSFRECFEGVYFFLGEFNARKDSQYLKQGIEERTKDLWYQHIIHPLSMQGLPISADEWIELFESVGCSYISREEFFLDQFIFRL